MGRWLKIEVDDSSARGARPKARRGAAPASAPADAPAAEGITLGGGAVLVALLAVAALAGAGWWVWRGAGPAGAPSGGDVLATVDGEPITARDVDVEYVVQKELQLRVAGKVLDESSAAVQGFRRDLLARLIDRWLAAAEASRLGIAVPEAELDARMEGLGAGFGVQTSLLRDAVLAAPEGLTLDDYRAWGRRMLLIQGLIESPQAAGYAERYAAATGRPTLQVTEGVVAGVVNAERRPDIRLHIDGETIAPVREGEAAPEIVLRNLAGETVALSGYRGRPVMINFWATWCGPCRLEMPLFQNAHETNEDLVVLAVNSLEPPATVQPYVDAMGLTFPVVLDETGRYSLIYRVDALPTTIFVDRDGVVVRAHRGAIPSRPRLKPMLDEILGAAPQGLVRPLGALALAGGSAAR